MKLVGQPQIVEFDAYNVEVNTSGYSPAHGIGEVVYLGDGRAFRFSQSGAVALVVGKLNLPAVDISGHYNMTTAAAAIGATTVTVTPTSTNVALNEYAEGFLAVSVTPGQSQVLKVSFNPAITASNTGVITLYDPIQVALTSSSKTNLVHNQWQLVVVSAAAAASATQRAAGVNMVAVPINNTCWLQTRGVSSVLNDTANALGTTLIASPNVAGAVTVQSATYATAQTQFVVGQACLRAGVDTQYVPIQLQID